MFFEAKPTIELNPKIACRRAWSNDVVEKLDAEIFVWSLVEAIDKQIRLCAVELDAPFAAPSFQTIDGVLKETDSCTECEGVHP